MDGVLRWARYAFGPNRLHLCGPSANRELWDYLNAGVTDGGLTHMLTRFEALYPYLRFIANEHHLTDPFDPRVVEAYWLGNSLLSSIDTRALHRHLAETLRLKDTLSRKDFLLFEERFARGILPNHNHHVLAVPKRMGHAEVAADLAFMDACRVSSGVVLAVDGPFLTLLRKPLLMAGEQVVLGTPVEKRITRSLMADYDIEMLTAGQIVSLHWDTPCEVLTEKEARLLEHHTLHALGIREAHHNKT